MKGNPQRTVCLAIALSWLLSAQSTQNIAITAVTNSADFQPGLPQQGSLASIFTTGLQGGPGIFTATHYPLSNVFQGISVWINFLPAPILAVAFESGYQQINVQVPWEGQRQPLYVEVFQNGIGRAHTEETQAVGIPPFYLTPITGNGISVFFSGANGYGIIQHASDYSLVTPQSPAHANEYLIAYGVNLAPVSNQPPSGTLTPLSPPSTVIPVFNEGICAIIDQITIGSGKVSPSFVGLAPGTVGVYQINFQVPSSVAAADLPLTLVRTFLVNPFGTTCPNPGGETLITTTSRSVLLPIR